MGDKIKFSELLKDMSKEQRQPLLILERMITENNIAQLGYINTHLPDKYDDSKLKSEIDCTRSKIDRIDNLTKIPQRDEVVYNLIRLLCSYTTRVDRIARLTNELSSNKEIGESLCGRVFLLKLMYNNALIGQELKNVLPGVSEPMSPGLIFEEHQILTSHSRCMHCNSKKACLNLSLEKHRVDTQIATREEQLELVKIYGKISSLLFSKPSRVEREFVSPAEATHEASCDNSDIV